MVVKQRTKFCDYSNICQVSVESKLLGFHLRICGLR
jgi:hypothetical protein